MYIHIVIVGVGSYITHNALIVLIDYIKADILQTTGVNVIFSPPMPNGRDNTCVESISLDLPLPNPTSCVPPILKSKP